MERDALEKSTDLFRTDLKIESLSRLGPVSRREPVFRQHAKEQSRGMVTSSISLNADGYTQAADGMRLERSPYYTAATVKELPTPEEFQARWPR